MCLGALVHLCSRLSWHSLVSWSHVELETKRLESVALIVSFQLDETPTHLNLASYLDELNGGVPVLTVTLGGKSQKACAKVVQTELCVGLSRETEGHGRAYVH